MRTSTLTQGHTQHAARKKTSSLYDMFYTTKQTFPTTITLLVHC